MIDIKDILEASPEHKLAKFEQSAFDALDEIMALAADPETRHLVLRDHVAMAQLLSRCQLINSFILVNSKPGNLKVVSNQ